MKMNDTVQEYQIYSDKMKDTGYFMPPHSIESEKSVIGGVISKGDAVYEIPHLLPHHFFANKHREIYIAIKSLESKGIEIDIITVSERLNNTGKLDQVGGINYIKDIAFGVPSVSNIKAYAANIIDNYIQRDILERSFEIQRLVHEKKHSGQELVSLSQAALMKVEIAHGKTTPTLNQSLKTAVEKLDERHQTGKDIIGIATGYPDIDYRTKGYMGGNMILLAARPSMGKTAIALNIAMHIAFTQVPTLVYSLEMPTDELMQRGLSCYGDVPLDRIKTGKLTEDDWPKISSAVGKMKDKDLFIEDSMYTLNEIVANTRKMVKLNNVGFVMIDYVQLIGYPEYESHGKTREIAEISRAIKMLAKELDIPILCLGQLNRELERRPNKRPLNSDLKDSGALEQDADIIHFIYRDVVYNTETKNQNVAEIISRKVRNGVVGTDYLVTELNYSRFKPMTKPFEPDLDEDEDEIPQFKL